MLQILYLITMDVNMQTDEKHMYESGTIHEDDVPHSSTSRMDFKHPV
jgi:hypothetical protein